MALMDAYNFLDTENCSQRKRAVCAQLKMGIDSQEMFASLNGDENYHLLAYQEVGNSAVEYIEHAI